MLLIARFHTASCCCLPVFVTLTLSRRRSSSITHHVTIHFHRCHQYFVRPTAHSNATTIQTTRRMCYRQPTRSILSVTVLRCQALFDCILPSFLHSFIPSVLPSFLPSCPWTITLSSVVIIYGNDLTLLHIIVYFIQKQRYGVVQN